MKNYLKYFLLFFCAIITKNSQGQITNNLIQDGSIEILAPLQTDTLFKAIRHLNDTIEIDSLVFVERTEVGSDTLYNAIYKVKDAIQKKITYYKSEKKRIEHIYENDTAKWGYLWYPSGKKKGVSEFTHHCYSFTHWYESGQIENEIKYNGERGLERSWFESGKLKTEREVLPGGFSDGYQKEWCENGRLIKNALIGRGRFHYKSYYCNGNRYEDFTYLNNSIYLVGKLTVWYENGKKMLENYYKDTDNLIEAHVRTGTWKEWDEMGRLIKQDIFRDNILINKKEFLLENKSK